MANISEVKFPVSQAMKNITITVKLTGLKPLVWRMKLGILLFKFAAWVIGCNVQLEGPEQ